MLIIFVTSPRSLDAASFHGKYHRSTTNDRSFGSPRETAVDPALKEIEKRVFQTSCKTEVLQEVQLYLYNCKRGRKRGRHLPHVARNYRHSVYTSASAIEIYR